MYYPLICLPLTTMIVCPGRMVDKGLLSGIPLGSLEKYKYINKLAKNEKYQNDKLYHFLYVFEVKESNEIVIFVIRGQL